MRYLLLLNNAPRSWEAWRTMPPEEAQRAREEEIPKWNELFAWVGEQGLDVSGLELDDPDAAKVVRRVDGETVVTDGPFAETKEQLGGFFIVDCDDLDQAIEVAKRVPLVTTGSVEIRPLVDAER